MTKDKQVTQQQQQQQTAAREAAQFDAWIDTWQVELAELRTHVWVTKLMRKDN
jgi:uncharacterized protein YaiL (DUF2058 family)